MGILAKSSKKSRSYTMDLQLTSMIDMFTILLVFLLKSYSVDYTNVAVSKDLRLPVSTETRATQNILNLIVTNNEILLDGEGITNIYNGKISRNELGVDGVLIKPLLRAMRRQKVLQEESIKDFFKGKVILQADRMLEYGLLHKVLYTAGEAGYPKFKLLVLQNEE